MKSEAPALILVLGDQLSPDRGALRDARPGVDTLVMAEVREEAHYVRHNRHKIAFIFAAMRQFHALMQARGFDVIYFEYSAGRATLEEAVNDALARCGATRLRCTEPGEYRLLESMRNWQVVPELVEDDRFLASRSEFTEWARGRRQLRMEYFYREMRRKHALLIDDGGPAGGQWNYDRQNRVGWRSQQVIPARPDTEIDALTVNVIALVAEEFPDNPGDLERFYLATTAEGAQAHFRWFLEHVLAHFGTYQDALAEDSPFLFHSLVSMYLNVGLLDPLQVCQAVEEEWRAGRCELAAAEGFIRQVLGWREYVRGIYWLAMPEYADQNALGANRPLPEWFWTGDTDLRCLLLALRQSLELGYAHHIQRLMVIGNFCLLAGLDVRAVCNWYLAAYVDAFEWVELPNTLGMALYGDNGLMASKPYAASGKYIQRQGDHCRHCRFDPQQVTGENACPYNSLYWQFLDRNRTALDHNPRMSLALRNWDRKKPSQRRAILDWAEHCTRRLIGPA